MIQSQFGPRTHALFRPCCFSSGRWNQPFICFATVWIQKHTFCVRRENLFLMSLLWRDHFYQVCISAHHTHTHTHTHTHILINERPWHSTAHRRGTDTQEEESLWLRLQPVHCHPVWLDLMTSHNLGSPAVQEAKTPLLSLTVQH